MSERELTPEQDESVRALLAGAKHTDPTPLEVTARLDDVLAGLVAERQEHPSSPVVAPVVTLASRRRRVASLGLFAAAAAVVGGVAVTQVLPSISSQEDTSGASAESSSDRLSTDSGDSAAAGAQEDSSAGATNDRKQVPGLTGSSVDADLLDLTSTPNLRAQLRAIQRTESAAYLAASPTCPVASARSAPQVGITYDGVAGTLVLGAPTAGRQRVDIYLCGAEVPERTLRISSGPRRP